MDNHQATLETIYRQLETLSLFELNRLQSVVYQMTEDENRNNLVKQQLKEGMTITYFNSKKNKLLDAVLLEIKKTKVKLQDLEDGHIWLVLFKAINIEGIPLALTPKQKNGTLDKHTLKIGDRVRFESNDHVELYGIIKKLNPKRAVIELRDGHQWHVPYVSLSLIIDGVSVEPNGCFLIEG